MIKKLENQVLLKTDTIVLDRYIIPKDIAKEAIENLENNELLVFPTASMDNQLKDAIGKATNIHIDEKTGNVVGDIEFIKEVEDEYSSFFEFKLNCIGRLIHTEKERIYKVEDGLGFKSVYPKISVSSRAKAKQE